MANRMMEFFRNGIWGTKPLPPVNPFEERGVSGTAVFGGYVEVKEKSHKLYGQERYRTASDILANVSIVAAGTRYFLNLLAKPSWRVEPAEGGEGDKYADLVEEIMHDMVTPWPRLIRRAGMYKYHGFGIHEWTAKRRDDGVVGVLDIESRPQHTIEQWQVDEKGTVTGVIQRSPQTGAFIPIPRSKVIYLIDDMLTDSPEGMGWFRHLVDPAERLMKYLQLEAWAFQRDLSGTPVGRAPLLQIEKMVKTGILDRAKADSMVRQMEEFIELQSKKNNTGILLDSQPHESLTADGFSVSSVPQWQIELLQGSTTSLPVIIQSLARLTEDMARIIGVENILLGQGGKGSLALSQDKSHNMYLNIDSALGDMAATITKDLLDPLWILNGWPEESKPQLKTEAVAFKDVDQIAATLREMASAGATLAPDDPAINDVRQLLGISEADLEAAKELAATPTMGEFGEQEFGKPELIAPKLIPQSDDEEEPVKKSVLSLHKSLVKHEGFVLKDTLILKNLNADGEVEEFRQLRKIGEWNEEDHPRVEAGNSDGGQFTDGSGDGGGGISEEDSRLITRGWQGAVPGSPEMRKLRESEDMGKLFEKFPKYSGPIYRGATLSKEDLSGIQVGKELTVSLHSSASKSPAIAYQFGTNKLPEGKTAVVFKVVSKTGRDITKVAGGREKEVVLMKGTRTRITKVKKKRSGVMFVEMEEI